MANVADAAPVPGQTQAQPPARTSIRGLFAQTEIDLRLFGMLVALVVILLTFNILSGGKLIQPTNMITMAVQAAGIAIIATGMVLVIVSRNIDLSVGSLVGLIAMTYALLMTDWFPRILGHRRGLARSSWVLALALGIGLGAGVGALQGFIIAYIGVPSFIVTLGGLLSIRGVVWYLSQRRGGRRASTRPSSSSAAAPRARSVRLITWILGVVGCVGDHRPARTTAGASDAATASRLRPDVGRGPPRRRRLRGRPRARLVRQRQLLAEGPRRRSTPTDHGITAPPGGLQIPTGFPFPIVAAHRRDAGDDLHRDPTTVRPVRVRLRRQPRRGRAGRHQHALDDPQDLRADGHPVRARRGDRGRPAQRRDARHRRELRAVRHRRGGRRRDVVRGRHRDDPGRRPRRLRDAVAGLRPELPRRQLARPERRGRHRPDRRGRPRHPATAGAAA